MLHGWLALGAQKYMAAQGQIIVYLCNYKCQNICPILNLIQRKGREYKNIS